MELTFTYLDADDVVVVEDLVNAENVFTVYHGGVSRTLVNENMEGISALFLPWSRVLSIESVGTPVMMPLF